MENNIKCNSLVDNICYILIVVGALNWGLIGLCEFNLVKAIFMEESICRIVYSLVGVAAVFSLVSKCMRHYGSPTTKL